MGKILLVVAACLALCACGSEFCSEPVKHEMHGAELAERQMRQFQGAIELYYMRNRRLPAALETLTEEDPAAGEPFMTSIPDDPWGTPYRYTRAGHMRFEILSFGEDTMVGTNDDIVWPPAE